jgi:hypothetical protein
VAELIAVTHDLFYQEVVVEPPAADFLVEGDLRRLRENRLDESRHRLRGVRSE